MSNERPTFELGIYDQRGDNTLLLAPLLASGEDLSWYQDDDSVLVFRVGQKEHLREQWNFGQISRIVPQLEHVRGRLDDRRLGLLRSAVLDEHGPPLLRFEPTETGETIVSTFFVTDVALRFTFPDRPGGDGIYALFEGDATPKLKRVAKVDTISLVRDLARAVEAGNELLRRAGRADA